LRALGESLRRAILNDGADHDVVVLATGGMSHQIHGTRFGLTNEKWDRNFLETIESGMDELIAIPMEKIMQAAGTEAAELSMWYTMRASLSTGARARYRYYTLPAVTGCGVITLDEPRTKDQEGQANAGCTSTRNAIITTSAPDDEHARGKRQITRELDAFDSALRREARDRGRRGRDDERGTLPREKRRDSVQPACQSFAVGRGAER
jgi:hypothetical protein